MRILLSIFLLCSALSSAAQSLSFHHYTSEQGFPETGVYAIIEDQRGAIWIGTDNGLLRFDGYMFRSYGLSDGLPDERVRSLFEDQRGTLWIGTEKGLATYDGRTLLASSFLRQDAIVSIGQTGEGEMIICARSAGIFRYNGVTLTALGAGAKTHAPFNSAIAVDNSTILAASERGLVRFSEKEVVHLTRENGLPENNVLALEQVAERVIWIGTTDGLGKYQPGLIAAVRNSALAGRAIHSIAAGNNNTVWLGTEDGIIRLEGESVAVFDPYPGQGRDAIIALLHDRAGNVWLGSRRGLSRLSEEQFVHYQANDQLGRRVYSIIEAINGNILCGTSQGGTTVFDGRQFSLLDKRGGFTSSVVQTFCYAPDSTLWVGTQDDGLYIFRKEKTLHYTTEDGLHSNSIAAIAFDDSGTGWIAQGSIIAGIRFSADTIQLAQRYGTREEAVVHDMLMHEGELWLGTSAGLTIVTPRQDTIFSRPPSGGNSVENIPVHCLTAYREGIAAGTSRGLLTINDGSLTLFTRTDGLSSTMIYSLTVDLEGNLWAGTDRGVDMITFSRDDKPAVRHFGIAEGFRAGEIFRKASITDRKGNVWFGTVNGLVMYNAEQQHLSSPAPRVHLTGMKLFFDPIENTPYGDSLTAWYPLPVALTLPHDQNNVTFSFVGINHRNPDMVRYRWMLEGFSNEWSPPLREHEAIFSNLPPGKYTFRVQASNGNAVWTDAAASYSFVIDSPWWEWWWLRAGIIIIVGAGIWGIFMFRLKQVQRRNRVIQERLMLENSVLKLEQEASRLQMNPHFIFNCLNSIQGLIAAQETAQAKRYLGKFGKLMRQILEHARQEFIPLEEELRMVENYLELEQLSTGKKFTFTVACEPSIDPVAMEIPPMVIQPFVENAVVHGIKRKEGNGHISVHFYTRDELLICEVTDNGIGREAAAQNRERTKTDHRSAAISITRQRLEQYGRVRNVDTGVTFVDLIDNGAAAGTRVIIAFPYERAG